MDRASPYFASTQRNRPQLLPAHSKAIHLTPPPTPTPRQFLRTMDGNSARTT